MSAAAIRTALRAIYPTSGCTPKVTVAGGQITVTVPVSGATHDAGIAGIVAAATGGAVALTGTEDYRHGGPRRRYTFTTTPTDH